MKNFVRLPAVEELFKRQDELNSSRDFIYRVVKNGQWKEYRQLLIEQIGQTKITGTRAELATLISIGDSDYRMLKNEKSN